MASAARLQRPIARIRLGRVEPARPELGWPELVCSDVIANRLYHKSRAWIQIGLKFFAKRDGRRDFTIRICPWSVLTVVAAPINSRLLLKVESWPKTSDPRCVFITGGTGYIGTSLIPILIERGHRVRALVRSVSKARLPAACEVISGNALDGNSYRQAIRPADTFIQLVGVPHPSPAKAAEFRAIDLVSAREAIAACAEIGMQHFIYLSVAHPAPMMKDYIAVRAECEQKHRDRHLNSTILRPWYVLGPVHRWPYALLPFYKLCELLPFARAGAQRLGLVTLEQLVLALAEAVESPVQGTRLVEVPEIRSAGRQAAREAARQTA